MKIGILSLQGGVSEHRNHLLKLNVESIEVKTSKDLDTIDGLILPGGESTTIGKIINERNLTNPIKGAIVSGMPTYGTCAGMVLLAKEIQNQKENYLALMNIKVRRNAYGNQINSFTLSEIIKPVSNNKIPLVFIRAPYIIGTGENVTILHKVNNNIVAAKEKNMLVTSFHPELSESLEFHRYFLSMC